MSEETEVQVIRAAHNIFEDLEFEPQEAANLKLRSQLMLDLRKLIQANHWTPEQAADRLNETPYRIQDLMSGAIEHFTIDQLLTMLIRAGMEVKIEVVPRVA